MNTLPDQMRTSILYFETKLVLCKKIITKQTKYNHIFKIILQINFREEYFEIILQCTFIINAQYTRILRQFLMDK